VRSKTVKEQPGGKPRADDRMMVLRAI